jgi:AAA+ superfamily predicted ATPase
VFWVATANDPDRIAAPLRSRFKEFRIEQPGAADAIEMAQAMVSRLVPVLAPEDFQIPPRSLVVLLAHLSAREIYQVLREAIARAVVKERLNLVLADLPAEIRGDEVGKGWLH